MPTSKKTKANSFKRGTLTDEEKRKIEQMISLSNYSEVGRILNRNPATIRKYCQRNGLTEDLPSLRKQIDFKAKNNHHFEVLKQQLTQEEYDFAIQVYKGMVSQFGSDILYSEETQIIEYCVITCLLNRALNKERDSEVEIQRHKDTRAKYESELEKVSAIEPESESQEIDKTEEEDRLTDRIERESMYIADLEGKIRDIKRDQKDFIDRKEKITNAVHGSREQRAKDIVSTRENFSDFMLAMKKDPEFRKKIGLEIERMRLGTKEEYIRLTSVPHQYMDGEEEFPILNTEVVERSINE